MIPTAPWTAQLDVTLESPAAADWLAAALAPESAREVPRGGASIDRSAPDRVAVALWARDAGAMRAALNTYLGWIELVVATARAADADSPGRP